MATAQGGFLSGQGQDKAGGPARALDTSIGNSNHRIQVVKEKGGLKKEVQESLLYLERLEEQETLKTKQHFASPYLQSILPLKLSALMAEVMRFICNS